MTCLFIITLLIRKQCYFTRRYSSNATSIVSETQVAQISEVPLSVLEEHKMWPQVVRMILRQQELWNSRLLNWDFGSS